ncbi:MAG: hypothetical protein ACRCYS_12850 [Beijerinckiaceae bacterium]
MDIRLGPDGDFLLTLPVGRTISIPNSPHAIGYLHSVLFNAGWGGPGKSAPTYPKQADVDKFMRNQARERKEQTFKDFGIDVSELTINI